jgi:peptidoglycan/xylan/chitin deacetylase (PgdA/CDA1 family)
MSGFVATWILAAPETFSGGAATYVAPPPRSPPASAPIRRISALAVPSATGEGRVHPIYSTNREWQVALTFDDGPHHIHTRRLLDILDRHSARATFFVNGYWLDPGGLKGRRNREVLRLARARGHIIGNHTFSHALLPRLAPEKQACEIMDNHRLITELTGRPPSLFRPPYGKMTEVAEEVLARHDYWLALWSATAPDHEIRDPETIRDTIMGWLRAYHGGIIMLHDNHRWSVDAAELLLAAIERENARRRSHGKPPYRFVDLQTLLSPPPESWVVAPRRATAAGPLAVR